MTSGLAGLLDDLNQLSLQQWLTRLVILLSPGVVFVAEQMAGAPYQPWYLVLLVVLALLGAVAPDGSVGLFTLLVMAWHWTANTTAPTSVWLLVAALAFVVLHVASALASYGPTSLVLEASLIRVWAWRALRLGAVTALVWLGVRLLSGVEIPGNALLLGMALLLLAGWALLLRQQVGTDG